MKKDTVNVNGALVYIRLISFTYIWVSIFICRSLIFSSSCYHQFKQSLHLGFYFHVTWKWKEKWNEKKNVDALPIMFLEQSDSECLPPGGSPWDCSSWPSPIPLLEVSTRQAHLQHLSPGGYPCFQTAMALSGDSVLLLGNVTAFPRAVSYNYRDHRACGEIFSLCFSWTQDSWSKTETATEKEEKHGYSVGNQLFLSHFIFISGKILSLWK